MTQTHQITRAILWLLALAPLPALAAQTALVYTTNAAGDKVHVIDASTNKVVQVINGVEAVHGVGFSPDGKRVYLSNEADHTLDVVDQKSGKILKKIHLSGRPNNIAVTNDGGRVVVALTEPYPAELRDELLQFMAGVYSGDPIEAGMVDSLPRPGRNLTGIPT